MSPPLHESAHRPWPIPQRPWIMLQVWEDLLFAHWPTPADALRAHIPAGLDLDTYDGRAWIGVIPFHISYLRVRGCPRIPFVSRFHELNVRTYVVRDGKPGVWFFSLDAASTLAVWGARAGYHLPYYRAQFGVQISEKEIDYSSRRIGNSASAPRLHCRYAPQRSPGSVDDPLARRLTERYCLYAADGHGRLYRAEIHHAPWPLRPARVAFQVNTMLSGQRLPQPAGEPLVHFADRLEVAIWAPERL